MSAELMKIKSFEFRHQAWIFAIVLVIAQAAFVCWSLEHQYQRTLEIEYARLADAARIADENISGRLRAIDLLLKDVAEELEQRGAAGFPTMSDYMLTRARAFPEVRTVVVTGPNGIVSASTKSNLLNLDIHSRPYYTRVSNSADYAKTFFSPLMTATPTKANVVFATRALPIHSGGWAGVVSASLEIKMFHDLLASILPDNPSSAIIIAGLDGRIISRAPDPERYLNLDISKGGHFEQHIASGTKLSFHRLITVTDHQEKISAIRTIADGSYVLIVQKQVSDALAPWRDQAVNQSIVFGALSIAVLMLTFLAVRHHDREMCKAAEYTASLEIAQELNERFRLLFTDSPDAQFIMELEVGIITECNKAAERLLGGNRDQIIGITPSQLSPRFQPNGMLSSDLVKTVIIQSLRDGQHRFQWIHLKFDGTEFWADVTISASMYNGRRVLFVAWRDISDHVAASAELQKSKERLEAAASAGIIGIWDWDIQKNVLVWDDVMYKLYGLSKDDFAHAYEAWISALHPLDKERSDGEIQAALRGECEFAPQFRVIWPDGSIHFIKAASRTTFGHDGRPLRMVGVNYDLTEQKNIEQVLALAKTEAEQASIIKSAFLANMSHEIRTPMNAILGLAHLLEQTSLDEHQRDYVDKVQFSARSLLGILNDILDLSKVEAGKMDLTEEPFCIDDLMKSLSTIAANNARDKDIEILFDITPSTPSILIGDSLRLQQILTNLVGNAIKFTDHGEVVIHVEVTSADTSGVSLLFSIRDTGIGIPYDKQEAIFGSFSQADGSASRRFGGSGLGLAISRKLVELAGGRIWCESAPGNGSTFYFTIHLSRPSVDSGEPKVSQAVPSGLRVLIADDNPTAGQILATMAASFGWRVVVATSGRTALEEIERAALDDPFDLYLLDWLMPDAGGNEIAERIKAAQSANASPFILLLASAYEYQRVRRESCNTPSVRTILTKPMTASSLLDAVTMVRPTDTPGTIPPCTEPDDAVLPLTGRTLLLVEDNSINQLVACRILEKAGAKVVVAGNGIKALETLSASRNNFDCILMDIQMPGMDGYETTRTIRDQFRMDAPIIAMTANAMSSDRELCLAAGMNDHISKPYIASQMIAVIARHTHKQDSDQSASIPIVTVSQDDNTPASKIIDYDEALSRTMGDHELLRVIMEEFSSLYSNELSILSRLLSEGDLAAVARRAHDLKGVSANVGAIKLANAVLLLQKTAEEGSLLNSNRAFDLVAQILPPVISEAARFAEGGHQ